MTSNNLTVSSTSQPDPWSEYSSWHNARNVREAWMRMMGMSEEEIARECESDPPLDLDEELENYNAMFEIQRLNAQR